MGQQFGRRRYAGVLALVLAAQLSACAPRQAKGYGSDYAPNTQNSANTYAPPPAAVPHNNTFNTLPPGDGVIPPPPVGGAADPWASTGDVPPSPIIPPPVSALPLDPPAMPIPNKNKAFVDPFGSPVDNGQNVMKRPLRTADDAADVAPSTGVHVVASGETLFGIARRYNTTPEALAQRNNLMPPYAVHMGQRLRVGAGSADAMPDSNRINPDTIDLATDDTVGIPVDSVVNRLKFDSPSRVKKPAIAAEDTPDTDTPAASSTLITPIAGGVVKAGYAKPFNGKTNHGIVYGSAADSPVRAAAAGTVVYVGDIAEYGKAVLIRHNNGLLTNYGYLGKVLTAQGRSVRAGEIIARSGKATVFEVRKGKQLTDPTPYLP